MNTYQELNEREVEMTISPELEKQFQPIKDYFEIEIMQGERRILQDGNIFYKFDAEPEKIRPFRQVLSMAIFDIKQIIQN